MRQRRPVFLNQAVPNHHSIATKTPSQKVGSIRGDGGSKAPTITVATMMAYPNSSTGRNRVFMILRSLMLRMNAQFAWEVARTNLHMPTCCQAGSSHRLLIRWSGVR